MFFFVQVDCPRNLAKSVTVEWTVSSRNLREERGNWYIYSALVQLKKKSVYICVYVWVYVCVRDCV